ncbi:hypothetical protein [Massilia yuzhufengensis]|nr:hypothetical protein [Massilia yuzhufengensis]
MVQDDAVYRCIGAQCGRLMPRRVNFCPWCGTAQHAVQPGGLPPPVLAKPPVEPARPAPVAAAVPTPAPTSAPLPPSSGKPVAAAAAGAQAQPGRGIPPPPGVGRGEPIAARPPERAPIKLRWWIMSLAALWLIWLLVRPEGSRIERRMERAVALAVECKARDAQDELIALRGTSATLDQLRQVQQSLNKAAADCTRAEQRVRAWQDTTGAVQKLRRARSYDKALARLAVFTKRWGEDIETSALRRQIVDEREHPLADPTRGE